MKAGRWGNHGVAAPDSRRGVVLAVCLLLLMLLIVVHFTVSRQTAFHIRWQSNMTASLQARAAARAGLNLALNLLTQDPSPYDSYEEPWGKLNQHLRASPMNLDLATVTVHITDELAKLNINRIDEATLVRVLSRLDLGVVATSAILGEEIRLGAAQRLADRILDYLDEDDDPRPQGLEKAAPEYAGTRGPRNGPMLDIREFLNIPGVTPEVLGGTGGGTGLRGIFTVHGNGLLNINTVQPEVLRAIEPPAGYSAARYEALVDDIMKFRPFMQPGALRDFFARVDRWLPRRYIEQFITYSTAFRIEAEAVAGDVRRSVVGLVGRDRFSRCYLERLVEMP
jgi:type II secretory pathway component PulK